jgi:hypothetical protein
LAFTLRRQYLPLCFGAQMTIRSLVERHLNYNCM